MRSSRTRSAAALVAVLAVAAALALLFRGGGPAPTPDATPTPAALGTPAPAAPPAPATPAGGASPRAASTPVPVATIPPIAVEEGRIRGSDPSGRVQWELRAATLDVDAERQEVRLTSVEGTFLERGQPTVTFTAPRALFDMRRRDVTMSGGVRARAAGGRSVEAQEVRYVAARQMLIATGSVRLTQERMIVRGDRLESDLALRRTRLTGRVSVTITE